MIDDKVNEQAKQNKIQTDHGQSLIGNKLSDIENAIGPKIALNSQRS